MGLRGVISSSSARAKLHQVSYHRLNGRASCLCSLVGAKLDSGGSISRCGYQSNASCQRRAQNAPARIALGPSSYMLWIHSDASLAQHPRRRNLRASFCSSHSFVYYLSGRTVPFTHLLALCVRSIRNMPPTSPPAFSTPPFADSFRVTAPIVFSNSLPCLPFLK